MTLKNYLFFILLGSHLLYGNDRIDRLSSNENSSNTIDLLLRVGLYNSNSSPGTPGASSLDGILLQFSETFSNCNDIFDANKLFGPDENIYTTLDDSFFSIQSRLTPSSNFNEVIDLFFSNLNNPQYKLYFEFLDDAGLSKFVNGLFLWDKCENTFTSISDLEVVNFDLTCSASNPFYGERFALVFKENPLVNDNSLNAIELPIEQASAGDEFTTSGATAENNEPAAGLNGGINGSVWFSFLAPAAGNVKITTDLAGGTADDTEIAVYSYDGSCSADFSSFNRIAYDDNSGSLVPDSSTLYLENLNEGERYFIQVDGTSASTPGTFGIEVKTFNVFTYNTLENYLPFNPNGQLLEDSILIVQDGTAVIDQVTSLRNVVVKPDAVLDLNANLNANILFESNASGSGQMANATGTTLTGEVTVERYIPANRAFRFLSSPVTTTDFIFENWQESGSTPTLPDGLGTQITGGSAANGFDQSGSNNPSMFTFNNSFIPTGSQTQFDAWTALPNTNATRLNAGGAYLILVRGDRTRDLFTSPSPANNTTLSATGNLHIGPRVFSSANNDSALEYGLNDQENFFSLVGNPFQAIVDVNDLDFNNVNSFSYWLWDPNLGSNGNYATVSLPSGNNTTSSAANQFIQPGQSFFVQTIADGAASLTFNEDDKNVDGSATAIFSQENEASLKLLLYTSAAYNSREREADGLLINFSESGNNDLNLLDADKILGPNESLARLHSNDLISLEHRAMPTDEETIVLSTVGYSTDSYTFVINASNIESNFEAYLQDNYTETLTPLNEGSNAISFSLDTGIPESTAANRFSLKFDNATFSIDDNTFGENFSLYPNPTLNGQFSIKTPNLSGEVNIEITNVLGQQVSKQQLAIESQQVNVNAGNLSTGVYVVKLSQGGQSYSAKLMME